MPGSHVKLTPAPQPSSGPLPPNTGPTKPSSISLSSALKPSTMLKFWPSGPPDQTTPKAGHAAERNPFDSAHLGLQQQGAGAASPAISSATATTSTSAAHSHNHSGNSNHNHNHNHLPSLTTTMPSPGARTPGSGARTPTIGTHNLHHHLLNAHIGAAAPSRHHGDVTPTGPLTPPAGSFSTAHPTTQLSIHPPEFDVRAPPPLKRATTAQPPANGGAHTSSSRGQIHVKLIQARGLNVASPRSRPYVVVQFEQNEFVGRDPIGEADKEAKGVATNLSRNNSSSALGTLERAAGNLSLQKDPRGGHRERGNTGGSVSSTGSSTRSDTNASLGVFGSSRSPYNPVWKHEVSFDVTQDVSYITFAVYDRAHEPEPFLGALELKPVLIHEHTVDQWHKLRARDPGEVVTGEIRVQIRYEQIKSKRHLTPRDFEFMKLIGRGTFGRVFQVRKKDTKRIYAMKVLSKKEIVAKKEVAHTIGERKILQRSLECPFLVGLKFSFQTDTELYLVTDFKSGGELFWHLQKETRFTEERARFYIAELVLALEHLHTYNIVYRDLKPENILLDATGHVALCDFGLSKPDLPADQLTNTFCGTTEYLAPEVLLDDHGYSKLVDFWSLGVLLFEMCCGWSPFYAEDTQQMYKNICFGKIRFPKGVISEDGKQFVKGLLNRNPKHRLGAQRDAAELKEHPFFAAIDWQALAAKKVTPPFKPNVESDESTANFDPEFTTADLREAGIELDDDFAARPGAGPMQSSQNGGGKNNGGGNGNNSKAVAINASGRRAERRPGIGSPLTSSVQENFRGFTYSGESMMAGAAGVLADADRRVHDDEAVSDEEQERSDEELDEESAAGRYARRRRGDEMDMDE